MEVEAVRFVSHPFEWSSITNRVSSVYHQWGWAEQSRRRVARIISDVDVAYLRVWSHDSLVTCPLILIDDVWFNVPRSQPLVLDGPPVDPIAVIESAADIENVDIELVNDCDQIAELRQLAWQLAHDADDVRSRRSFAPADVQAMSAVLNFASDEAAEAWFEAVGWVWRSGFDARLVEYRRNDEVIGWTIDVDYGDIATVAAGHVEWVVADWTSPR